MLLLLKKQFKETAWRDQASAQRHPHVLKVTESASALADIVQVSRSKEQRRRSFWGRTNALYNVLLCKLPMSYFCSTCSRSSVPTRRASLMTSRTLGALHRTLWDAFRSEEDTFGRSELCCRRFGRPDCV